MPCIIPLLMQYVVDHARAIDIIKVVIKAVDRLLGRKKGEDMELNLCNRQSRYALRHRL